MSRKIKAIATTIFLLGLFSVTGLVAFAAAPSITSATYEVSTGKLSIVGTNLVAIKGANNDIDLSKMIISDGLSDTYTLKTKGEITNATTATVVLNDTDKVAVTQILDKSGTNAMNGGEYSFVVKNGWNGPTSVLDYSSHALTVSSVPTLSSATFDITTSKLVLTGANLASTTGASNDIMPKYLTITNGASKAYTLTTNGIELTEGNSTTATITLNAKDSIGLQMIFNKNGTASVESNSYTIRADFGWNGKFAKASINDTEGELHAITVSNYAAPTVTATETTATYGATLTTKVNGIATDKAGTLYLIPASTDTTGSTKADLEALVTAGTALKATVATKSSTLSISTKTLKISGENAQFKAVAVDIVGTLSVPSTNTITINNIAAPKLSANATPGTAVGTTKVTATAAKGNTLAYKISDTVVTAPLLLDDQSAANLTAYTSGTNISGLDITTNKYLSIYELDTDNKLIKFTSIKIAANYIKAPAITGAEIASTTTITVSTDTLKASVVPAMTAFKVLVGKTYATVTGLEMATDGNSLTITLRDALKDTDVVTLTYSKPTTNFLQDTLANAVLTTSNVKVTRPEPEPEPEA